MLVSFNKCFIMEGEAIFTKRKYFWSKPQDEIKNIYLRTFISGVCDETELNKKVEELLAVELKRSGWGKKFLGWTKILTYEEGLKLVEKYGWRKEDIPTGKIKVEPIKDWPIDKAIKELTMEQLVQFLKDYDIKLGGTKNV